MPEKRGVVLPNLAQLFDVVNDRKRDCQAKRAGRFVENKGTDRGKPEVLAEREK